MKRRKMKNVLIVVTILIVSAIVLAVFLLRPGTSDIEISSQGMSSNEKEQQIKIDGSRYTGMLVRPVYSPNEYSE